MKVESEDGLIDISAHGQSPAEILRRRLSPTAAGQRLHAEDIGPFGPTQKIAGGGEILMPGGEAGPLLLVAGAAGEVRTLDARRRQILRLRLPGDVIYTCDHDVVRALGRVTVADARPFLQRLGSPEASPLLRRAWLEMGRVDQNLNRDHMVRLGRMTALERVAHLLLETHARLADVGLTEGDTFQLPTTQDALSDLLGLSGVHLSRTLQALRREKLVSLKAGRLVLLDRARLIEIAGWRRSVAVEVQRRRPQPDEAQPVALVA